MLRLFIGALGREQLLLHLFVHREQLLLVLLDQGEQVLMPLPGYERVLVHDAARGGCGGVQLRQILLEHFVELTHASEGFFFDQLLFDVEVGNLCLLVLGLVLLQLRRLLLDLLLFCLQLLCYLFVVLFHFFRDLLDVLLDLLDGICPVLQDLRHEVLGELHSGSGCATGALRDVELFEGAELLYQAFESLLLERLNRLKVLVVLLLL